LKENNMYIVTFYSFKGGVGRTLSLANIGLELARTGRRVLLVDFDLESPGIDTFEILRQNEPHPGMVEYVSNFMTTRIAPDVNDFVYEALGIGQKGGRLWVMPAGKCDEEYSKKLSGISWKKLYEEFDGFLMFEDLKAQWRKYFEPDYILIDSRTGHTDTEGICTRQLPDAVVVLFFPNEQNLAGLKATVSSIRSEKKNEPIRLHYVMSNVPDLDDELEILSDLQRRFHSELGYKELTAIIHRYDSLFLLKQSLFLLDRPKSRLAKEYLTLLNAIIEQNIQDRRAVIQSLKGRQSYRFRMQYAGESQQKHVEDILKYHSHDGEVLYLLAMNLKRRGRLEESQMLLRRSIELDYRSPEALLAQAEVRLQEKDKDLSKAYGEVWEAFQSKELSEDEICRGIEIIRRIEPKELYKISKTPVFDSLTAQKCEWIAEELMWSKEGLEAAIDLLSRCRNDSNLTVTTDKSIRLSLSLALIGLARFEEAMKLFGSVRPAPKDLDINDSFNYGMAEWGKNGTPHKDMFERVIDLGSKRNEEHRANYYQCLAVAFWIIDRNKDAIERIEQAKKHIIEKPKSDFSCWRYMKVTPPEFQEDCNMIRKLIEGEKIKPKFFPKA
jgi:MinD-like ATPase involved in chromosome partitioning or flagellar assembly